MLTKSSVLSALLLSTLLLSSLAWAAEVPSVVGTYAVSGKAQVSANFPGFFTLKATLPNVGIVGDTFYFDGESGATSGSFNDDLLGMYGTWTQDGANFVINLDTWVGDMKTEILALVGSGFDITVNDAVFAGKMGKGSIKGKFLVNFSILANLGGGALQEVGTVILSGSLTGTPVIGLAAAALQREELSARAKKTATYVVERRLFPVRK